MTCFFPSLILHPKITSLQAQTIFSEAKHSISPWYSSTPSRNSLFSWRSPSRSTDSRVHMFRNILEHGPYNFSSHSYYNKHGFSLGNKWCRKKGFGRDFFSLSKKHHHKLILSKLAPYRNSIVRLFDSKKLQNYPTPKILCNLNKNYLVPSSSAAIGIRSTPKRTPHLLLSLGATRHYHHNRRLNLTPKYYLKSARFIKHVKEYSILYMVGLGVVTIFLIGSWETIPYSKRKHLVIVPASKDKSLRKFHFRIMREEILPRDHPDSVRVRSISNQILQALQSDLKIKQMSGLAYSPTKISSNVVDKKEVTVPWWRRTKFSTGHLEGLNWEVVVVDSNRKRAYALPGGKIVVYKGILKHCKSDAQVATVIGHEVGHVVARHAAERYTKLLWLYIGWIIFLLLSNLQINKKILYVFLQIKVLDKLILNPGRRSNEKEADYIGLLLMASAAYDPREAPEVYEMLDDDHFLNPKIKFILDLLSTHPSGKNRVAALSKPKVMEEAMTRFSKAIDATRGKRSNVLREDLMFADLNEEKFVKVRGSEGQIHKITS